jgi:hypothetical protein
MIEIEKLTPLTPPYEIFEFVPCQPAYFRIVSYEIGRITITPRWPGAPPRKEIVCVRLHVDPATKPYYPHYWDITPSRLVHQLAGMLTAGIPEDMWLRIHRDIPGPKAHFSVGWVERPP